MKRISLIVGACVVVFAAALPAGATPNPAFTATVRADGSVSLFAGATICKFRPCSYGWYVDGVHVGTQRSFVTRLEPGCHAVDLVVRERRYRNPTDPTATASQEVCVTVADGTTPVEEPPVEELPAEEPPVEEPPVEEPPVEEPPFEEPPVEEPPVEQAAVEGV